MPNGYRNQPISGFTGYMPGAKWQVGSRYVPQQSDSSSIQAKKANSGERDGRMEYNGGGTRQNFESSQQNLEDTTRTFSEMSNDELRERMMKMQMDMQNLQMAMSAHQGSADTGATAVNYRDDGGRVNRRSEYDSKGENSSTIKERSKSVPRRIENNPFDGIESGWWSKGEVRRNKERRDIANGGQMVTGGNWNQRPPSRQQQRVSRRIGALENDSDDIPAAGYSGHIQGLRQLGVGKPFTVAAKQAKQEYIERRRTYSGSRDALNGRGGARGTQFSEEVLSANPVKLPDNHRF